MSGELDAGVEFNQSADGEVVPYWSRFPIMLNATQRAKV